MSKYDNPYTGTLDGWYECVVHSNVYMTKGRLYFFYEGQTVYDNDTLSSRCDNIAHFNSGKVAKIKKTKKAEEMSEMLNGHYVCTRGFKEYMTVGKVYEFVDGQYCRDNGEKSGRFSDVHTYNTFCKSQIAPYTAPTIQPDRHKLRSGDKLIDRRGIARYVLVEVDRVYDENGGIDTFLTSYHYDLSWQMKQNARDIMEVWRDGELIMKREEKTAQELEIERIESEMRALSEAQNKLADDLKKARDMR